MRNTLRNKEIKIKTSNQKYLLGLSLVPGLGPVRTKLLLTHLGPSRDIWQMSERQFRSLKLPRDVQESFLYNRGKIDLDEKLLELEKLGLKILTLEDASYPSSLLEIYDPPVVLYVKGYLDPASPKVGVVGTRLMTTYGHQVTELITRDLVGAGLAIVSGLARGVDALAHRTTLEAGGQPIAVLGSGLSRIYPPENKYLAEEVALRGALISEYPPEAEPARGTFPSRNRIIAGLSLGVVVTEAGEDSGSLITANLAADQGRLVFSIPGQVTSRQSIGANNLIKVGAKLVSSAQDILEELDLGQGKIPAIPMVKITPANETEAKVLEYLSVEPIHIDDLAKATKLPVATVGSTLTVMVISGKVTDLGGSFYARKH